MKKRSLFLLFLVCALLCGCAQGESTLQTPEESGSTAPTEPTQAPPPVLTGDEGSFSLSFLPEIGQYAEESAPRRMYAEYTDELIPSDGYGELIPYLGYTREFSHYSYGEWGMRYQSYFGLCTTDGVIVTDPVYSSVSNGEEGYYLLQGLPDDNADYPFYIAKTDGSRVVKLSDSVGGGMYLGKGIYCTTQSKSDLSGLKMYNREGEVLYDSADEGSYVINLPVVNPDGTVVVRDYEDGRHIAYFVDERLRCTSAVFESIEYVRDGEYIVKELDTAKYGILDIDGNYIVPSDYDMIIAQEDEYITLSGDTVSVTDRYMNTVSSFKADFEVERISNVGPSIIELVAADGTGGRKSRRFDRHGNEYGHEWEDIQFRDGYYCFTGDENSAVADADLNILTTLDGRCYLQDSNGVKDGYISVMKVEAPGEWSLTLYCHETGHVIEGVSAVGTDYYMKESADGTKSYYDYDGTLIPAPKESEPKSLPAFETKHGDIYFSIENGFAYTRDEQESVIVKLRVEKD